MNMNDKQAYFEYQNNMEEGSDDERRHRKKRSPYYPSNTQGTFIVNAITGVEYPWRVGTKEARRLFHSIDTAGRRDKQGYKLKVTSPDYPNPNPNNYYYDSPQQYMQHQQATLTSELIEKWNTVQQEFVIVQENQ